MNVLNAKSTSAGVREHFQRQRDKAPPSNEAMTAYVETVGKLGSRALIPNVETRLELINVDGHLIPYCVNNAEYDNAAFCSEYNWLAGSVINTIRTLPRRWWITPTLALLLSASPVLRACRIDKVVRLFNDLLRTQPPPDWTEAALRDVTERLCRAFPDHAVKIGALSHELCPATIKHLEAAGYVIFPYRSAYVSFSREARRSNRNVHRSCLKYEAITTHEAVGFEQLTERDFDRLAELYRSLARETDPRRTALSFLHFYATGLCHVTAMRSRASGQIDAFIEYDLRGGIGVGLNVGYDKDHPSNIHHYHGLMSHVLRSAAEAGIPLVLGSGASRFKQSRGARPIILFNAFYVRHLPLYRRIVVRLVAAAMIVIGRPVIERMMAAESRGEA